MKALALALILVAACVPQTQTQTPTQTQTQTPTQTRPSGCREDMPDCVAACALRETSRPQFVEWFDQRCAAAILGKNPDHVAGKDPPPQQKTDLLDTR